MPRFVFSFVLVSSVLFFATKEVRAQDVETPIPSDSKSQVSKPDVGSPDVEASVNETKDNKIDLGLASQPNPKKSQSLLEEFFSSPLNYFLVLVVCLYIYLMFIQPKGARNEKQAQLLRLNNLKKNDRVVTTAGIHGIVSNINTDAGTVTLRVDENSNAKLTIDRDSIRSVAS